MGNDLTKPSVDAPADNGEMRQIKMGSDSKYYENIGTLNQEMHITVLSLPETAQIPIWSRECYNLFVIDGADFQNKPCGSFDIIGDAILTKGYTSESVRSGYLPLTNDGKSDISSYPCIFANRNRKEGTPGTHQAAVFGFITEIRVSRGKVTIHYQAVKSVSQKALHSVFDDMGIKRAEYANEFDIVHWAIKEVDLLSAIPGLEEVSDGK